jgi:oligopeptide/dipeptide ABC transporter ATP-binding protein
MMVDDVADGCEMIGSSSSDSRLLLDVIDLEVTYDIDRRPCRVVRDASLSVGPGEIVGLVGESGSGKTVTAMACIGMTSHLGGKVTSGQILLDGRDVTRLDEATWRSLRGRFVGAVFQHPTRTLNPAFSIGYQLADTARRHLHCSRAEAWDRAVDALDRVHIARPAAMAKQYPHQFSGGMCQRAAIALAIVGEPRLIIADEPTSALDQTVQRKVLELLLDIRDTSGIGVLFITHDLGVVGETCDRVAVMYSGSVVEQQNVVDLFVRPRHPYTSGLLRSIPEGDVTTGRFAAIAGNVMPPDFEVTGCRFEPRCSFATEACLLGEPILRNVGTHVRSRCVRAEELHLEGVQK